MVATAMPLMWWDIINTVAVCGISVSIIENEQMASNEVLHEMFFDQSIFRIFKVQMTSAHSRAWEWVKWTTSL